MSLPRTVLQSFAPVLILSIGAGCQKPAPPAAPPSGRSAPPAVAPEPVSEPTGNQDSDEPVTADAAPVDLADYCRFKAASFDSTPAYPWAGAPRGSQTFAHVPLEISGAIFLWGERNASRGMTYPEEVTGIPIGREFETLYVCHAAFFEADAGTPMCEVRFQYDDGTSASDEIVCGDDARDWFVNNPDEPLGPSDSRSTLAWDGEGKMGDRMQAIRFCLTAVPNPHPDRVVTTIDLVSSKTQTAACILAITTGAAGLMQTADDQPAGDE